MARRPVSRAGARSAARSFLALEGMLETAAHIERVGLSRDGTEDWCGRPCTIHALNTTSKGRYDLADEAQQRLRDNLGHPIGRWSDATPQGEVVAKLRAVALGG